MTTYMTPVMFFFAGVRLCDRADKIALQDGVRNVYMRSKVCVCLVERDYAKIC